MQLFHFWSRDVHPVQKLLLCTKFHENRMFFTEMWRYIDFQNGGRPPSWNCFTTIRDHPRSLCCWPQLPVKFHVNTQIWRFEFFAYFQAPKWGFWGTLDQKAHPCVDPCILSYQNIRWGVWQWHRPVDRKCDGHTHTSHTHTQVNLYCVHA